MFAPRLAIALLLAALPASAARGSQDALVYPVDIAAAGGGFVVADFKLPGLLAINEAGAVSVIARGQGLPRTPLYGARAVIAAPDGDGWLVADPATFGLYRVRDDGTLAAITVELDIPQGLARFDDGSVLVSDLRSGIGAVMRVTLDGVVTVFAEIDSPKGIVADGDDGFAVVSHGERALYRLGRDASVSTLHRGAPFEYPHDLVRLPDGSFVVTDGYARALFRVSSSGEVTTLSQGPPLVNPQGIARAADGTLVVVDPQAGAVFRVDPDGAIERWIGAGEGSPPLERSVRSAQRRRGLGSLKQVPDR
jgi:sugar lactone lactonase YvrE